MSASGPSGPLVLNIKTPFLLQIATGLGKRILEMHMGYMKRKLFNDLMYNLFAIDFTEIHSNDNCTLHK